MQNVTDQEVTSRLLRDIITDPVMREQDYMQDHEFRDMYNYLRYNQLTNDDEKDRMIAVDSRELLFGARFVIQNFTPKREERESFASNILSVVCA